MGFVLITVYLWFQRFCHVTVGFHFPLEDALILSLLSRKLALSFSISIMSSIFLLETKYAVRHYKNINNFLIIESYFTLNGLTGLSYFSGIWFQQIFASLPGLSVLIPLLSKMGTVSF